MLLPPLEFVGFVGVVERVLLELHVFGSRNNQVSPPFLAFLEYPKTFSVAEVFQDVNQQNKIVSLFERREYLQSVPKINSVLDKIIKRGFIILERLDPVDHPSPIPILLSPSPSLQELPPWKSILPETHP